MNSASCSADFIVQTTTWPSTLSYLPSCLFTSSLEHKSPLFREVTSIVSSYPIDGRWCSLFFDLLEVTRLAHNPVAALFHWGKVDTTELENRVNCVITSRSCDGNALWPSDKARYEYETADWNFTNNFSFSPNKKAVSLKKQLSISPNQS